MNNNRRAKKDRDSPTTVHIIAGPTASGKTAYALEIADKRDGIIINADSMQVYDALPILTARPRKEEQAQAPHRLFAIIPPWESCTVQRWRDMAAREIEDAAAAGKTPILVGGTGFYIKALTEGLSPMPEIAPATRKTVMTLQKELGNPAFHAALAKIDPVMADRLDPNDTQRLIRAYEVIQQSGKSLAAWQAMPPEGPPKNWDFKFDILLPDRAVLHEKINRRLDEMIDEGALDEVRELDEMIRTGKVPEDAGVTKAHGFRPLRAYLHGEKTLEQALEATKAEIRQYAKRQTTWLRHQIMAPKKI